MSTMSFSPTEAVRESCQKWMDGDEPNPKCSVSIHDDALDKFAFQITETILANKSLEVAEWDSDGWHYTGMNYSCSGGELMRMERVALYILTLDAINFCFWPTTATTSGEGVKNRLEYEHLAIALRKIAEVDDDDGNNDGNSEMEDSTVILAASAYALSPTNLASLTPEKLQECLEPHIPKSTSSDQIYELPNIETRCRLLNELGNGLIQNHEGSALHMIAKANQSADALVGIILDTFPGFRDYIDLTDDTKTSPSCGWDDAKISDDVIHFYKRAQIAVADIWAALGRGKQESSSIASSSTSKQFLECCLFKDMDLLTTFPDYRVPQILRHVGAISYTSDIANKIDQKTELAKFSADEISIRAATVVAVENLVTQVKRHLSNSNGSKVSGEEQHGTLSDAVSAVTIDWYLWQKGEKEDRLNLLGPHHRVRTTFY